MDDLAARIEVLERAAREGGRIAEEAFRTDLSVEAKRHVLDAVTEVDRAVQRHVVEVLSTAFPEEPIVADEEDALKAVPDAGPAWLVDPIDGTNNFVAGTRCWGTSIATVRDGEPLAAVNHFPALGDTYRSTPEGVFRNGDAVSVTDRERQAEFTASPLFGLDREDREAFTAVTRALTASLGDIRRAGSSQATLSRVAAGELDAAVSTMRLPPWDSVAGVHLVRQAGGTVTDADGEPWRHDSQGLIASNGAAHDTLVDLVAGL